MSVFGDAVFRHFRLAQGRVLSATAFQTLSPAAARLFLRVAKIDVKILGLYKNSKKNCYGNLRFCRRTLMCLP